MSDAQAQPRLAVCWLDLFDSARGVSTGEEHPCVLVVIGEKLRECQPRIVGRVPVRGKERPQIRGIGRKVVRAQLLVEHPIVEGVEQLRAILVAR